MELANFSMFETLGDVNFNENATNSTVFDYVAEHVVSVLSVYYTPLLVTLGSVGNLLSVFVFFTSKLRHQSTSQYLSALAISDTIFLLQLLPPWLKTLTITDIFISEGFCQLFTYVSYVTCCVSSWLVVSFTVERFVAVLYPLRRNILCTVTRARHIILSVAVVALVLAIPVLRFAVPINADCDIDDDYLNHAMIFNWADTAISFTIPMTIIMILNAWIMTSVWKLERTRQQLGGPQHPGLPGRGRPARLFGCTRSQQRITRMLLIVSTVFVVLNLPAYTLRIIVYTNQKNIGYSHRWQALQQIALMSFHTNFGINFILYCLSGQNFRRALRQALPTMRRRPQRGAAVRRTDSSHPARANSVSTSFVSCTEATSNVAVTTPAPRSRRRETFISRWTFDNSRQRQQPAAPTDNVPMAVFHTESIS